MSPCDMCLLVEAWITGASNLAMLPAVVQAVRYRLYHESAMGLMTMFTSSAYHVCQSLNWEMLGFNEGRWHHMDNVFAIICQMAIIVGFAQLPRGSGERELMNASSVSLAVVAQLMAPWDVRFTVAPLVAAFVAMLTILGLRKRPPRLDARAGRLSILFLMLALVCFVKGLDDRNDWLRLWHGFWHVFVGAFCFYAIRAQNAVRHREYCDESITPKDA